MAVQLCAHGGDVDELFVLVVASSDQVDDEVDQAHDGHEQVEIVEVVEVEVLRLQPTLPRNSLGEGIDAREEAPVLEESHGDGQHGQSCAKAAHSDGRFVVEKLEQSRVGEEDGCSHDHQDRHLPEDAQGDDGRVWVS